MKLPRLATMVNLSESTFYRQFVQEFGMPRRRCRSDNHSPLHIIRGTNITRENIS